MINKYKKDIMKIILFSIFFFAFIYLIAMPRLNSYSRYVENNNPSICDLRGYDFSAHYYKISLNNILFYANEYLSPNDPIIDASTAIADDYAYGTEKFTIIVPDNDMYNVCFMLPGFAGRVFINGELVKEIGTLGKTAEDTIGDYRWCVLSCTPNNNKIEIIIHAANFINANNGIQTPDFRIGKTAIMDIQETLMFANSYIIMGGLIGTGFLLAGIWFFHLKMVENLWFSLECFLMAMRAGLTGDTFHRLFYSVPFMLSIKLEFISLPLSAVFLALFFNKTFPRIWHKNVLHFALLLYGTITLSCFFLPAYTFSKIFNFTYIATSLFIIYFSYRLITKIKTPEFHQLISIGGILIFFAGVILDFLHYSKILKYPHQGNTYVELALILFVILQMISLFIGNAKKTADAMAQARQVHEEKAALLRIDRLKTEFLGNISHELKTPLTVIKGYAQLAQKTLSPFSETKKTSEQMKLISSEADRLAMMVSEILDVTRIEEGAMVFNKSHININILIKEIVEMYQPMLDKHGNKLIMPNSTDALYVYADEARISQVIINLLSNAEKHTKESVIKIATAPLGYYVVITVSDKGKGIKKEYLPHVFERFKSHDNEMGTIKTSGTGLGLYICKYIVENHGGTISIESEENKGTKVTFTLPIYKD